MSAWDILFALGLCVLLLAWCFADRGPVDHAPCDCAGCETLNQGRPRHLPLKPQRDRLAKGGSRE